VDSILVSVIAVGLVGLLKVKALQEQQELMAARCVDVDSNNIKIVLVVVINRQ
jgi:hypothetical protein